MVTQAQKKATAKYEKNNYFKTLVRFPIDKENEIKEAAAATSLNNFIVSAVLEKLENKTEKKTTNKKEVKKNDPDIIQENTQEEKPLKNSDIIKERFLHSLK